jgi:hypothetical protein
MIVVAKLTVAHNTMKLFRGPMSFGVREVAVSHGQTKESMVSGW